MRLTVLGSNGTYPTPGRPASGYLVTSGEQSLLLDMGQGVFAALMETGVLPSGIVLSHRHPDHCVDLLALLNHLRIDRQDAGPIPVLAPVGVASALGRFIDHGPRHDLYRVFDHRVVSAGHEMELAGFALEFAAADHPVPAICVRVEGSGTALVYSGDTGPAGELGTLARGAGTLLCEATLQGEVAPDRFPHHLYASEAGGIADDAGVTRLILTHLAPSLDPELSVAEARREFGGEILTAIPGLEVEL